MNIREIIELWLIQNGYDGLCNDDCGCEIKDLMPCDGENIYCKPGYKHPGDGEAPFCIKSEPPFPRLSPD